MTQKVYLVALLPLALLSAVYAIWTQPLVGPESDSSAIARALILIAWLALFSLVLRFRFKHWSWVSFVLGFACGGGWMPFVLVSETFEKSLPMIALGIAYGTVSGLYAATSRSPAWAIPIGIAMLLIQFCVDFAAAGFGLIRITWGM